METEAQAEIPDERGKEEQVISRHRSQCTVMRKMLRPAQVSQEKRFEGSPLTA